MDSLSVLIIGGGLGGLALAQSLKKITLISMFVNVSRQTILSKPAIESKSMRMEQMHCGFVFLKNCMISTWKRLY